MTTVHIGKKIKEVLGRSRFGVKEFATRINRSRTVLYDIFERSTIDTGLLQKISKELEHDFFSYYNRDTAWVTREDRAKYISKNDILSGMSDELNALKKQLKDAEKRIELLEKVNKLLEEKGSRKK